ncbi:MAG: hypothetical protein E7262_05135 [Lachnospiraceae bacterium]|nr:hypothetical protein [Lachnospiraceae bacterium]
MKIEASMVNMASKREYASYVHKKQVVVESREEEAAAIFDMSLEKSEKDLVTDIKEHEKNAEAQRKEQQEKNLAEYLSNMLKSNKLNNQPKQRIKAPEDLELQCLRKIIENLNNYFNKKYGKKCAKAESNYESYMRSAQSSLSFSGSLSIGMEGAISTGGQGMASQGGSTWVRTTATSAFVTEVEHTTFETTGMVKTSDGREISFGVSLEMSRAFCAKYDSLVQEEIIFTDPLIINMDGNVGNVSDQKFLFDLNSDGQEEEVSFAGQGSGFLAIDKNKDGKINDGNELFGTKSGNGFKDLAEYDSDHNGWIDENDEIFDDLRVWTKGPNGEDRLVSLLESDVGAIYLGYTDTEFTLNNFESNEVNGMVRSTGVFLKESGGVGTVQHVDLAL